MSIFLKLDNSTLLLMNVIIYNMQTRNLIVQFSNLYQSDLIIIYGRRACE